MARQSGGAPDQMSSRPEANALQSRSRAARSTDGQWERGVRTAGGCRVGHLGRGGHAEAGAASRPIREESPQAGLGLGGNLSSTGHTVQRCRMHVATGPLRRQLYGPGCEAEGLGPEP